MLEPPVPHSHPAGRRQTYPLRHIVDAIFCLLRTGAQMRLLAHGYLLRYAVFCHYAQWREDCTWEQVTWALRESYRCRIRRYPQPTAAIICSQSVKITKIGGPRGYDGAKKVKGCKRHRLVDPQGTLLKNDGQPDDVRARATVELRLLGLHHPLSVIERLWADTAYHGLNEWWRRALGWKLSVPQHRWTGGTQMQM
ncbi:transposase [Microvirga terrae]|uniref:Transposase n=1 Tax=Microvirga terrae TaxID=2740529 RepID=A0ABY5RYD0_9HYPH|nr:transposase [Microvirga terrae]UVF22033.1 transposase [Microvirga terrae]